MICLAIIHLAYVASISVVRNHSLANERTLTVCGGEGERAGWSIQFAFKFLACPSRSVYFI